MEIIKMLAVPFAILAITALVTTWIMWGKFMIKSLKQK